MPRHAASSTSSLRYALRTLRRSPGFVAAAVLSLGLALALNTTMFALIDAVRHPPVPYASPERVVVASFRVGGKGPTVSPEDRVRAMREGLHGYQAFTTYMLVPAAVQTQTQLENQYVAAVDPSFFGLLGIRLASGRALVATDALGRAAPEAVISFALWHRLFAGKPLSSGLMLHVGQRLYTIVGVMPRGAHFPQATDVWVPAAGIVADSTIRKVGPVAVIRLEPAVTYAAVRAQLDVVAARLNRANDLRFPLSARLTSLDGSNGEPVRKAAALGARGPSFLATTAMVVLVIACANLGAMMLARGVARRRETAIRIALGAGRAAVVRHVLIECGVLVGAGAALGVLLTVWALWLLPHFVTPYVPQFGDLDPVPSWRVFAFVLLAAASMVVLAGVAPAVHAAASDPGEPLKDGSGSITSRHRDRYNPLVVVEVALSTALLMSCALFVIYVVKLSSFEFRFAARRLVTARVRVDPKAVADANDVEREYDALLASVRALPGARGAATRRFMAAEGSNVIGENGRSGDHRINIGGYWVVSPDYFGTLGVAVVRGRNFEPGDATGESPVVIVDDSAAKRLWPDGSSPVGRMLKLGHRTSGAPWVRVVGVVRSVSWRRQNEFELPPAPDIYVVSPHDRARERDLFVQSADPDDGAGRAVLMLAVQRVLMARSPALRASGVLPALIGYEQELASTELMAWLFAALGSFGLTLCSVGLYGILAYSVRRRLREYAIRIALGSPSHDLVRLVVHDVAVMALAGIGIGAFVALWLTHAVSNAMSSVPHADVLALVSSELVLLLVSAAACLGPLRQAIGADPVEILRAT